MNKLDAELMVGTLLEHGYQITDRIEDAGAALYVTCSVRQHAENRVLSKIGRLKARKRRDADFVIGLMGCMAQKKRTLWRGISVDLFDEYEVGKVITWWSV